MSGLAASHSINRRYYEVQAGTPMLRINASLSLPVTLINDSAFVTVGKGSHRRRISVPKLPEAWDKWCEYIAVEHAERMSARGDLRKQHPETFTRPLQGLGITELRMEIQQKRPGLFQPYFIVDMGRKVAVKKFGMLRYGMPAAWTSALRCLHEHRPLPATVEALLAKCPTHEDLAHLCGANRLPLPINASEPLSRWTWRPASRSTQAHGREASLAPDPIHSP